MTNRTAFIFVAQLSVAVLFSGCFPESEQPRQNRYGVTGDATTMYDPAPASTPSPGPTQDVGPASPEPAPIVAATPIPAPEQRLYGAPVPGKPGFITSPHSPFQGQIDARGFPPGTEVKDPYSGKIILVP